MKRNTITLYVKDEDKEAYKAFQKKAEKENKSVSEALLELIKEALK